ncbi:MAG: geranylgeranylglycerol-phosphate geranylgeranyltransferase [Flavisolibacter sp.]|nr:geranylgeranylglycerol-phosphate geranylgeranyltransferase [Flavisolibacter sp.]
MEKLTAFMRLVRWQNLMFIVLTQVLFYFCVYKALYKDPEPVNTLLWIVLASVLIAAAGYIINDYFDLNIDQINKPGKNVINKIISRRWAIILHLLLSSLGILATALAVSLSKWYLILANLLCVFLLWQYSTSFKRQLLIGNIVISFLTAWTVLIIFFIKVPFSEAFGAENPLTLRFFRIAYLYAGFAFIISLVRETIKDVEDREGDVRYGCRTLPIVAGVLATKIYIAVWLVVLIVALVLLQLYILQLRWVWAVLYSSFFIILPLVYFFYLLYKAKAVSQFAYLSSFSKWIMLTGILSLIFFRLYF